MRLVSFTACLLALFDKSSQKTAIDHSKRLM